MRYALMVVPLLFLPLAASGQQGPTNPECRWSKPMRSDQSIVCPNDGRPQVVKPFDEQAYARLKREVEQRAGSLSAPADFQAKRPDGKSYIRTLLNYDIADECRKSIMAMRLGLASGDVIVERDVPDCINKDTTALSNLDRRWNSIPSERREQCLAAFGRAGSENLGLRYFIIAQCVGLNIR